MEAINNIKNYLLQLEAFDDVEIFAALQEEVRKLIGVAGVSIGITPFFYIHDRFVFSAIHSENSLFLKNLHSKEEKESASEGLKNHFNKNPAPLIIPDITDDALLAYSFINHMRSQGWNGLIVCPLRNYNQLIGVLEIASAEAGILNDEILIKVDAVLPLFELAVNRTWSSLDARIDKIIKEQFTAIQPSVEWRFVEGALNFLLRKEEDEDAKMEPILFDHVYPLYGAIDIRNSSTERNKAIQQDMLEQLQMAADIIKKAEDERPFPLLAEISFKIKKYRHSVSNIMLSDDEIAINQFFRKEIVELFEQLKKIIPALQQDIDAYFAATQSTVDMVYKFRRQFDESVLLINRTLARFLDKEQQAAQKVYPHYFERFVTDGLDFNIYIGQAIAPTIPFTEFYLRNLKIWQLTMLAKAALLTHELESRLPITLQTTQLILAHHYPISISFRSAERKFDVEGAYNIRYEIIKKRIDKVHIRNSNERLTQPGTIAIVYSQPEQAAEYQEYIEFLRHTGLLKGEVECLDLEELQGVTGLKALRVQVNIQNETKAASELKAHTNKR